MRDDAQDLAERGRDVLAVARVGVVADADVEVAVGPELQLAAVVVGGGVGDAQHGVMPGVGDVGARRRVELPHHERAVQLCREGVDEPGHGVVGRERDGEQPALTAVADLVGDVDERRREDDAVLDDAHGALALDHEDAARVARRRGRVERRGERPERGQRDVRHVGVGAFRGRARADDRRRDGQEADQESHADASPRACWGHHLQDGTR